MSAPSSPRKGGVHSSPVRAPRRRPSTSHHAGPSSLSPRRVSRQARSPQPSDSAEEMDDERDAAYDEDLDAEGEDDEEYLDHDAQGEEKEDAVLATVDPASPARPNRQRRSSEQPTHSTPRQSSRPKRSRAQQGSYYDLPPLPNFSDAEDDDENEDVAPSIRKRSRRPQLLASDAESEDTKQPRHDPPAATSSKVAVEEARPSSAKPEVELTEEEKRRAREVKEQDELAARWTDEYFEIIEQLPLEMHRAFALMRELEGQMHTRVTTMVHDIAAYRALRLSLPSPTAGVKSGEREGSEDEAETLLGPSSLPDDAGEGMEKVGRMDLLRGISQAANETVKAAEEKMGLAATAYEWIDRHIRRLDGDIGKLEASILLGLRSGTQESRGAREALGLPLDEPCIDPPEPAVVSAAESASLTKSAGARNSTRSTTTTPKSTAAKLPSPRRSRSPAAPQSPQPKRKGRQKPRPLSPQKGGRRSKPNSTTVAGGEEALVGPDTSEMPYDPTEPTYCYCDQISFDNMVACDNDDCPIEWFHYACVGLDAQPKAEWFCRFCAPPSWKGPGMKIPPNAKHIPPPPNKKRS